jgi:hypothetical protein
MISKQSLDSYRFDTCQFIGTTGLCYQDQQGPDSNQPQVSGDDNLCVALVGSSELCTDAISGLASGWVDPVREIARLRNSINLLEAHIFSNQRGHVATSTASLISHQPTDREAWEINNTPNVLAIYGAGQVYVGPTSAATHLLVSKKCSLSLSF